jgi:hypothetical protein
MSAMPGRRQARHTYSILIGGRKMNRVEYPDRHHERFDLMVAVCTPIQDLQEQVQLGWGQYPHGSRHTSQNHAAIATSTSAVSLPRRVSASRPTLGDARRDDVLSISA